MNINDLNLDAYPISTNSFSNISCRKNIHVLLVEHEAKDHDAIMNMLNYFSYKATSVRLASTALTILSKGKARFDFIVANINSPDSLVFHLLHEATKMNLRVIFMTNADDEVAATMAVERGALLCVTKSMMMGILGCLWQFLLDNKTRQQREKESRKLVVESSPNINNMTNTKENLESMRSSNSRSREHPRLKRKGWTEWTLELHGRFMAAAKQLGQGKCYPKDILELMNVPGLTRMQVASHLQKCRNASWLPPNDRKLIKARNTAPRKVSKTPRAKPFRFGLMPEEEEGRTSHKKFLEYHQNLTINPPPLTCDRGERWNPCRLLDHGFYDNTSLNEEFVYGGGDHQTYLAPATNYILSNLISEEAPFDTLHSFPGFQQQLDMNFNGGWQSFSNHEGEKHGLQVAAATNEWFGEAVNPYLEKD